MAVRLPPTPTRIPTRPNTPATGPQIFRKDTLQLLRVVSFAKIWWPVAGVFLLAGVLVGVGGSLTAIRKFLQV